MSIFREFNISMIPGKPPLIIHVSQYESDFVYTFNLVSGKSVLAIPNTAIAVIRGTKRDGNGYSVEAALDAENHKVVVMGDPQLTACAGRNVFELAIINDEKTICTANFFLDVERAPLDSDTIQSETVLHDLQAIINSAATATQAAEEASASAASAASAAEQAVEEKFEDGVAETIDEWLTDHPEATTTVQDGSLTYAKLVNGTLNFVTPEMYGAKGDGVTDDTVAIQSAVNSGKNVLFSRATYVCGRVVIRNSNVILDGNLSTLLHGADYGFVISKDAHDVEIRNFNSVCTYEIDSQAETNVHIQIGADNDNPDSEYFAYNITVKNCSFYGGVVGFSATSVKNILIENCKFDGFIYKPEDVAGGYGILLQSCINVRIVFCDFSSGAYGRHDVYVSIDQRKTQYKRNKNITIDSCSFDHSELVLVDGTNFYSSITVPINVRASSKVTVTNSHFYSVTGAVNFFATNGEIDSATVKNCIIDTPVYNACASEVRYIIGVMGTSDNHITADVFGITLVNVPEGYTNFVSLKNCDANVYACNIKKTNVVCNENVLLHLWDAITTFTSYFIRFVGGDETKGFCKNITFLNGTLSPSRYYFSEGSSAGVGFHDTVQIRVTLPSSAGFTEWAELPDKMNPEKCYCSGIGLLHSSGRRFGQGTNSASARIFVELGTAGYRVYNDDSQYFNTRPYIYISPIPGS